MMRSEAGSLRMKRRRAGEFIRTAALCVVTVGISLVFSHKPDRASADASSFPVAAQVDRVEVPVPAAPVPSGTRMRDVSWITISYPRHQLPEGALISAEAIPDGIARAPFPAKMPVARENIALSEIVSNPVTERIPPGMRAMTLRVDAAGAVEGWAGSDSIVDVLLVERDRTTVIAERVKVLSAERSVAPVDGSSAPQVPSTVTVLVTPEQCLAINTAIPLGRIAFALRTGEDEAEWAQRSLTVANLSRAAINPPRQVTVSGLVSFKGDDGALTSFALTDGRWIKASSVPDGFSPSFNEGR